MRRWLLGTPLPDALAEEGLAVLVYLRSAAPPTDRAERAFAFIYAVGETALTYHFSEPLQRLGVGPVTRKPVDVALSLALKGLRTPLRRVLLGMDDAQLHGVAEEIEFRLYPNPHGGREKEEVGS